ncbi:MAG TPA: hypothetical protein VLN59_02910 [Burkholderiales bacterium]|nr:hypothetical protein [Burkholderiales bacterium]
MWRPQDTFAPGADIHFPVVANYSALNVSRGMVFIDFGFLEPGMLAALPRMAQQGSKLPETVQGRLAVRVAMGYDELANLDQQLGRVLAGLSGAQRPKAGRKVTASTISRSERCAPRCSIR